MSSALDRWVLGITVALCVVLGLIFLVPEPAGGHGAPHPDYPTMLQGGTGAAPRPLVSLLAWTFGLLVVAFVVATMAFGAPPGPRRRRLVIALAFAGAAWAKGLTALVAADYAHAGAPSPPFFLGLPLPTAIMLYGVWFVPWALVIVYVIGFRRLVLTAEDRRRFDELVAKRRATDV